MPGGRQHLYRQPSFPESGEPRYGGTGSPRCASLVSGCGIARHRELACAAVVVRRKGQVPLAAYLAGFDVVVNCVLQHTDAPLMFVTDDDLAAFSPARSSSTCRATRGWASAGHRPHRLRTPWSPWAATSFTTPWTTARRCCGTPPPGRSVSPAATSEDRAWRPWRVGLRSDHPAALTPLSFIASAAHRCSSACPVRPAAGRCPARSACGGGVLVGLPTAPGNTTEQAAT